MESTEFVSRRAWAVRLEGGLPVGESFPIGGSGSGTWIRIHGNVAVWNGGTVFVDGNPVHGAIVASELPLPGATDIGDVDQTGGVSITDAIIVLDYLYRGGWKPRRRLADVDGSGSIQLTDAVLILKRLFAGERR
jgi:hypothetical protein